MEILRCTMPKSGKYHEVSILDVPLIQRLGKRRKDPVKGERGKDSVRKP